MKVICPKCQYENQADSSRVVCARCATIIEVRSDQGTGLDSNGKRQTARLPFATNNPQSGSQPLGNQSYGQNSDIYATRVGDDFDDVLEIPRQSQPNYQGAPESSQVYEDVFASPGYDSSSEYDFSSYEKSPTTPIESFQTSSTRQRETQDYTETPEPEFMGWPVLPENSLEEEETSTNGRTGLLARVGLIVAVFGILCTLAYYFLGDFIAKRKGQEGALISGATQPAQSQPSIQAQAPVDNGNPGTVASQNSQTTSPPQTAIAPPIITPKPSETETDRNARTAKNDPKQVDIPPINAGATGRTGHSQTSKPAQPETSSVPAPPNRGNLTVQVGSYNDQAQADDRVRRLKSAGADARVVRADIAGRGVWYRVQVGGFTSRDEALNYGNQLKSKGLAQDFIVTTIGK
jgi:cell division protein FtsN